MKNKLLLLLLLATSSMSIAQTTLANKLKISANTTSTTATKVNVQEADGTVNTMPIEAFGTVKQVTGTDGVTVANGSSAPIIGISSISQLKVAGLVTDLGAKVDKIPNKSLLSDSEIARLLTLVNYTHPATHSASIIVQDATNRFVTDAEKATWNGKQNAGDYTTNTQFQQALSQIELTPGPQGAKGDTGAAGVQGIQGDKGDKGDAGKDGSDGAVGPQGPQGIQGETGLRGIQGETGPQGPIGFTGAKGADGTGVSIKGSFDNVSQLPASGANGDAYLISGNLHVWNGSAWANVGSIQGPQGLIGLTGAQGLQGAQGLKGDKGDQGIQGAQGPQGVKGDTGIFVGSYNDLTDKPTTAIGQGQTAFSWGNHAGKYLLLSGGNLTGQVSFNENTFFSKTIFSDKIAPNIGNVLTLLGGGSNSLYVDGSAEIKSQLKIPNGTLGTSAVTKNQLDAKEDAFTKNNAFNKTFGVGSLNVAAGNDPRINNGETAFGWGNHAGKYLLLSGGNLTGQVSFNENTFFSKTIFSDKIAPNIGNVLTLLGGGLNNLYVDGSAEIKNDLIIPDGINSKSAVNKSQLDKKEDAFTKNNAFNKTFGVGSLNVAEGNDPRINNGQTAFSWGNHASAGYSTSTHTHSFAQITNKPTTLAGYGITDGVTDISGKYDKSGGTISGAVLVTGVTTLQNTLSGTSGSFSGSVTASSGFFNSDLRLKNISKRDGDVAYYTWKDGRDSVEHTGYIAQEVKEVYPNQVKEDEKGMLSVNYVEVLVAKIRNLEKRIDELEKQK